MKIRWNRKLWNALKAELPEGYWLSYNHGYMVLGCEDSSYYSPWYGLTEILRNHGF